MLNDEDEDDIYNVVNLLDSFTFRNHLILTFEVLGDDLKTF